MRYVERAPAKTNIFLSVGNKDPKSGFHDLESAFFPLELGDTLSVEISPLNTSTQNSKPFKLSQDLIISPKLEDHLRHQQRSVSDFSSMITGEGGLVSKTLREFARVVELQDSFDIRVSLEKVIPDQAGLGGGSADAAALLRVLEKHFEIERIKIIEIAGKIGADVNPCLYLNPTILLNEQSIYHQLSSTNELKLETLLLIKPPFLVSTKNAFSKLKRRTRTGQSTNEMRSLQSTKSILNYFNIRHDQLEEITSFVDLKAKDNKPLTFNDFEEVVLSEYSDLKTLKANLRQFEPTIVSLSGSGSTLFASFKREASAREAQNYLSELLGPSWWLESTKFL